MLRAAHSLTQVQRRVLVLVLTSAVVYVLACVGCASCQRRFIYFPPVFTPAQVKEFAAAGKLEPWQTPDGKLIGWKRLCVKEPATGQVLILHGNAGCAFQCGHYVDAIQKAAAMDVFERSPEASATAPRVPIQRNPPLVMAPPVLRHVPHPMSCRFARP